MRYIKTYESYDIDDIKSLIMECFYDLTEDDDFRVRIDEKPHSTIYFNKRQGTGFLVSLNKNNWNKFAYTTIEPYIERLANHIEDKYKICLIEVEVNQASIDMGEWDGRCVDYVNDHGLSVDDYIFSECIIYLEEK